MEKRRHFTRPVLALGLTAALLVTFAACGGTKTAVRSPQPTDDGPRRILWVLPLVDQARADPQAASRTLQGLLDRLQRSAHAVIRRTPEDLELRDDPRSGKCGIVTDPRWIEEARRRGVDTLVSWFLPPPDIRDTKAGVWPLRTPRRTYRFSVAMNLVDVTLGIVLDSRVETVEAVMDPGAISGLSAQEAFRKASARALPELLDRLARAISRGLRKNPWSGLILQAGPEEVTLGCGRENGVREGDRFEVFSWAEQVRAYGGRTLHIMGEKKGVITVFEVRKNRCLARPLEGGPFEKGQWVRYKS
ncbi:MAG: hypothetical protein JRJ35_13420 [Deltaproteobacteria bacterium]|nr:hypothetical protein [Deltaproteobacteria bacterium]